MITTFRQLLKTYLSNEERREFRRQVRYSLFSAIALLIGAPAAFGFGVFGVLNATYYTRGDVALVVGLICFGVVGTSLAVVFDNHMKRLAELHLLAADREGHNTPPFTTTPFSV